MHRIECSEGDIKMIETLPYLVLYRGLSEDKILKPLSDAIYQIDSENFSQDMRQRSQVIGELNKIVYEFIHIASEYGFGRDLWKHYIAYLIAMDENPFSLSQECLGMTDGSMKEIGENDFKGLFQLFFYDFTKAETKLGYPVFHCIKDYRTGTMTKPSYLYAVGDKIKELADALDLCKNEADMYKQVTAFYKKYGVGQVGLNKAFRIKEGVDEVNLLAIANTQQADLSSLIGYERQKKQLLDNTEAFVNGLKCNNVLLFGDSGTGKSTSVKAILNQYYGRGLRMIELYKHQFSSLSSLISLLKHRNYKFIIFMDDLSFEEFEIEYKYLKAVIEGGLEMKPDNILIYATSNRRHLIRETWSDRSDMSKDELHHSDTMEEKLSLVSRFGITINFSNPNPKEFIEIVKGIAKEEGITLDEEELIAKANIWELHHGGRTGRTAKQFINYLLGQTVQL